MASHYRHYWGKNNSGIYNLQWDIIRDNSFVVITASEGSANGNAAHPGRFVGDAYFSVSNVAPHQGGVTFRLDIGHYLFLPFPDGPGGTIAFVPWPILLDTYTDFTVF